MALNRFKNKTLLRFGISQGTKDEAFDDGVSKFKIVDGAIKSVIASIEVHLKAELHCAKSLQELSVPALSHDQEEAHNTANLSFLHVAATDAADSAHSKFQSDVETLILAPLRVRRTREHKQVKRLIKEREKLLLAYDVAKKEHDSLVAHSGSGKVPMSKIEQAEEKMNAAQKSYQEIHDELTQSLIDTTDESCAYYHKACLSFRAALAQYHAEAAKVLTADTLPDLVRGNIPSTTGGGSSSASASASASYNTTGSSSSSTSSPFLSSSKVADSSSSSSSNTNNNNNGSPNSSPAPPAPTSAAGKSADQHGSGGGGGIASAAFSKLGAFGKSVKKKASGVGGSSKDESSSSSSEITSIGSPVPVPASSGGGSGTTFNSNGVGMIGNNATSSSGFDSPFNSTNSSIFNSTGSASGGGGAISTSLSSGTMDMGDPALRVFAVPIGLLPSKPAWFVAKQESESLLQVDSLPDEVPWPVELLCSQVEKSALEVEGVFRIPGSKAEVDRVRRMLDSGQDPHLDSADPNTCAHLLKLYFRELPTSLLPFEGAEKTAAAIRNVDEDVARLVELVAGLDEASRFALYRLCQLMSNVAAKSEVNKMTLPNLAVCLGPSIIRAPETTDARALMKEQQVISTLTRRLFELHEQTFAALASHVVDDSGAIF